MVRIFPGKTEGSRDWLQGAARPERTARNHHGRSVALYSLGRIWPAIGLGAGKDRTCSQPRGYCYEYRSFAPLSPGLVLVLALVLPTSCFAADANTEPAPVARDATSPGPSVPGAVRPETGPKAGQEPDEPARRDERFKKLVTNVKLSGHFTMDGQEDAAKLQKEEYVITGAIKLGNGELWALTSRIKYGTVDLTVPVPVQVKWAGDTPVITLDKVGIPGLGTFSARVVLDQDRYAGTWSHDQVGGHLFGRITPVELADKERGEEKPATSQARPTPENPAAKPGEKPPTKNGPKTDGG